MVRDELRIKAMILSRVIQEASKAVSFVEHLTEDCHGLRRDLQRQEALVLDIGDYDLGTMFHEQSRCAFAYAIGSTCN